MHADGENDYLQLSGIQHYAFCPRQWALAYLENQWSDNFYTVEGNILHERVDDPYEKETRGGLIVTRAMRLVSHGLKLSGQADAVEFHQEDEQENAVRLEGYPGWWRPYPIEYKRGKPKPDNRDKVQLCAQAICLEEMLGVGIPEGALFYGEIRRREKVIFTKELRGEVEVLAAAMATAFSSGQTPSPVKDKRCKSCSLLDICLPVLGKKNKSAALYLARALQEEG